jgi:hypothetical protein
VTPRAASACRQRPRSPPGYFLERRACPVPRGYADAP